MGSLRSVRFVCAVILALSFSAWYSTRVEADDWFCVPEVAHLVIYQNPEIDCGQAVALGDAFCELCYGSPWHYGETVHCYQGSSIAVYCDGQIHQ
jgi:hypothetical protein